METRRQRHDGRRKTVGGGMRRRRKGHKETET